MCYCRLTVVALDYMYSRQRQQQQQQRPPCSSRSGSGVALSHPFAISRLSNLVAAACKAMVLVESLAACRRCCLVCRRCLLACLSACPLARSFAQSNIQYPCFSFVRSLAALAWSLENPCSIARCCTGVSSIFSLFILSPQTSRDGKAAPAQTTHKPRSAAAFKMQSIECFTMGAVVVL